MKLMRYGAMGAERPAVLLADGRRVDATSVCEDFNEAFFAGDGLARLAAWVAAGAPGGAPVPEDIRTGPAVARPSKLVCVGLNYRAHAEETGAPIPKEPVLFMKATTAWSGPFDDVQIPPGSEKTDWEVELAVVIGKRMTRVARENALDHVAGWAVMNDYSERAWQKERGGQWVKGKSADTFAPFGPWLVTRDELPDAGNLRLWLSVNGERKQDSSTADLIFPVDHILSAISEFMTLLPGDVVSTGTPSGVGMGHVPPVFLRPGDVVEASVEGLGTQRQRMVAAG